MRLKQMKLGRVAGISDIAAQHITASGMVGFEIITEICIRVPDCAYTPDDWRYRS